MSRQAGAKPAGFGDLGVRFASSLVLAGLALFDLWLGGIWVALLAALACGLMLWELQGLTGGAAGRGRLGLAAAVIFGAGSVMAAHLGGLGPAGLGIAIGAALAAGIARPGPPWLAGGVIYIGFAMAYLVVVRNDPEWGLSGVLWIVLVVVAADIGAYFAGRSLGGPKLSPRLSPSKTWSGAIGGLIAAVLVGAAFAGTTGAPVALLVLLSLGIAVASQLGDLLESAVKRYRGFKDASRLIPGHGGLLDRLDGLLGGLWFFAIYDMLVGVPGG